MNEIKNKRKLKQSWILSDLLLDVKKQRKMAHQNGFDLASPIKRNGLIGNGYAQHAPLTNISSSSTTSSLFTNNSSVSMNSGSSGLMRSPRFQPLSPRNPVTGIGCNTTDGFRGRRRNERGILSFLINLLSIRPNTTWFFYGFWIFLWFYSSIEF